MIGNIFAWAAERDRVDPASYPPGAPNIVLLARL